MIQYPRATLATLLALIISLWPSASAVAKAQWQIFADRDVGFSFRYPSTRFSPAKLKKSQARGTRILLSQDGRARLIVASGLVAPGESIDEYRKFLLKEIYPDARVTYAPVKDDWFVLSGHRGREIFYERVVFACDGRMILSWALTYRTAERSTYDRIVEEISRSFKVRADEFCPIS